MTATVGAQPAEAAVGVKVRLLATRILLMSAWGGCRRWRMRTRSPT